MTDDRKIRRTGITGIFLGLTACLLCKLPFLLAVIGFAGLAGGLSVIPFEQLELVGVVVALLGALLLVYLGIKRIRSARQSQT